MTIDKRNICIHRRRENNSTRSRRQSNANVTSCSGQRDAVRIIDLNCGRSRGTYRSTGRRNCRPADRLRYAIGKRHNLRSRHDEITVRSIRQSDGDRLSHCVEHSEGCLRVDEVNGRRTETGAGARDIDISNPVGRRPSVTGRSDRVAHIDQHSERHTHRCSGWQSRTKHYLIRDW